MDYKMHENLVHKMWMGQFYTTTNEFYNIYKHFMHIYFAG